jgi:hypothetical protein
MRSIGRSILAAAYFYTGITGAAEATGDDRAHLHWVGQEVGNSCSARRTFAPCHFGTSPFLRIFRSWIQRAEISYPVERSRFATAR